MSEDIGNCIRFERKIIVFNSTENFIVVTRYEPCQNSSPDECIPVDIPFHQDTLNCNRDNLENPRCEEKKECSSFVGMRSTPGEQRLNLGKACMDTGTIQHEFLHALGFIHEHQRADRDRHIEINFNNIKDEFQDRISLHFTGLTLNFDIIIMYTVVTHVMHTFVFF